MGLLDRLFKGSSESSSFAKANEDKKEEKVLPWIPLQHVNQLETIKKQSKTKPQFIFKHSTRCGISRMVINQFVSQYNFTEDQANLYYLDLLTFRSVSDEIGYIFQVLHQSPQLLVIKNGVVVAHASHSSINGLDLDVFG